MFVRDYGMTINLFRLPKRKTGSDCINALNLLIATKPAPRRKKKLDISKKR